jgi:anti-sigma B factor antagonist
MVDCTVHTEVADGQAVLTIKGDVDMAAAPVLESELDTVLEAGVTTVVFDLGAVGYLDSTGLRSVARVINTEGVSAVIRHASDPVHRILEITGLDQQVALEP